jgi:hypothetical protein
MTYSILTLGKECCLIIKVKTASPIQVRIVVEDSEQLNTQYTNRVCTVMGDDCFYVNIPVCGNKTLVSVYNDAYGNTSQDNSVMIKSIVAMPLNKNLTRIDYSNQYTASFINFATRFCYNGGWLDAGTYTSDDRVFEIIYQDDIIEDNGSISATPARIHIQSGVIELSRNKYVPFTIPERMAILLHEFCHIFVNENMDNEIEADLNALNIYLSLGYPRIEAFEVFTQTFIDTPTDENKTRFDEVKNFIDAYDNNKLNFLYE